MNKIISKDTLGSRQRKNIEELRKERKHKLVASLRLFALYNFDEGIAGHITVRDPEFVNTFWVNPFGKYFGVIEEKDLIRVSEDGKVVDGEQNQLNKAAYAIHSGIHKARPDVICAVHAHSFYGRVFSATNELIKPFIIEATPFYNDHVLFNELGGVYMDFNEGDAIAKCLGTKKAAILRNHGLLTVGETVDSAVWWFIAMERSCQTQLLLRLSEGAIELTEEEAQRGYDQLGNEDAGYFQFQPLYEKVMHQSSLGK